MKNQEKQSLNVISVIDDDPCKSMIKNEDDYHTVMKVYNTTSINDLFDEHFASSDNDKNDESLEEIIEEEYKEEEDENSEEEENDSEILAGYEYDEEE